MVAHVRPMHVGRAFDPLSAPSGVAGIDGGVATTVDPADASQVTSLAVDGAATPGPTQSAPPLDITDPGSLPATTVSSPFSQQPTPSPSPDASAAPTAVAAASTIPLSTVVGSCVGAFIGATALIVLGLWFYRRYSRSLKQRSRARGPLHSRNVRGDEQRRRSRLEPWNKLDDEGDNKYQMTETKEVDQVAPMEKLTMFKKTPSVRTAYTHKSTDVSAFHYPESYAEFDPKLAQTLNAGKPAMPEPKPFLAQVDMGGDMSWDTDTIGKGSFFSANSQISSPTTRMAIPTPPPVEPTAHRWESAEVVQYSDATSAAESTDPFNRDSESEHRKSVHNPFFNAQDYQPRSRSNSVTKSAKAKGKERMRYSQASQATDPFDDPNGEMNLPPRPVFAHHVASASSSSTESKEKALQSLIAALDMPEDQVRDRLRIASMQPSIISQASSALAYEEDMSKEFPLPPSRPGGSSSS
ncbi:hypothetical protein CVT26_003540 [Gymnopilus dilepis]|uniref:Uncharacterized protein n=1 Tax=Gymnopilus dilepis TaxID=231916 RepID=A0A409VSK2_9AGAR|nr:hypothetical protein CVT26_003540 [Gymnopilus dilepis]